MAKVSIIIPVKNTEEISQQCLESLVHQTLSDIEIICVNMGGAPCSDEEEAEAPAAPAEDAPQETPAE